MNTHTAGKKRKRKATVMRTECVACGVCAKVCPKSAIEIYQGIFAEVLPECCVGCGACAKACPASVITMLEVEST